ncbi:XRE family transcriptional regulator [Actinomadura sp. 7K507]|nr:XRE family transcriptional regulator [Actinomadura sp. 7K507]
MPVPKGASRFQEVCALAARKPTRQTIAFGEEVARLRHEAGLSRLELAERAAVSRSYIAQVENGTTRCRRDFAIRLDEALSTGTTLTDLWDDILKSSAHPKFFTDYSVAESSAELLRMYAETFVIGLLQTEDYARVLLPTQVALEGRLKRQQILEREAPPRIVVVLAEVVLTRQVGTPEVMYRQCERLLEVSEWDHVTLQIAPTAYYRGVSGTFSIATQPTGEELLYQEMSTGGVTSQETGDILHCVSAFAEMQARCLSVSDSRDFIRKAMKQWTM